MKRLTNIKRLSKLLSRRVIHTEALLRMSKLPRLTAGSSGPHQITKET